MIKKLDKILHTENSEILFSANNLNLVKTNGPLEPELTRIINDEKLYSSNFNDFNGPESWGSTQSSVQYSAAVTAYGRMYLNNFKNMKDILYIGGDTDSIILNKKFNNTLKCIFIILLTLEKFNDLSLKIYKKYINNIRL